ncbi:hypothetical protein B0T26DRAFT_756950 [Lasiosphaeria miniovina]|uniref:Uncharacterized protein n=1 Tax=Lasiosphaeria miniovina TaxID=1954250 RepID=A0AA39ZTT2_9PEZI|nr:uncharacterized protein B0T26DRAFT_756950 [Lasiosphaeria miniovina]KAK0703389.1 hypothetical protein B0T26DRAFT_756950 [Lasiosphaeria miniovina]
MLLADCGNHGKGANSHQSLENIVKGIIEGESLMLVSSMTMEEIFTEREEFKHCSPWWQLLTSFFVDKASTKRERTSSSGGSDAAAVSSVPDIFLSTGTAAADAIKTHDPGRQHNLATYPNAIFNQDDDDDHDHDEDDHDDDNMESVKHSGYRI